MVVSRSTIASFPFVLHENPPLGWGALNPVPDWEEHVESTLVGNAAF
jgi:hypothetical protein